MKGYELDDGRYVMLKPEELDELPIESTPRRVTRWRSRSASGVGWYSPSERPWPYALRPTAARTGVSAFNAPALAAPK